VAVDARIVIESAPQRAQAVGGNDYSHLAILPYPRAPRARLAAARRRS
jgi:hypothetical protein